MSQACKKVAIITGASSGIGRSACLSLARRGWAVVLVGRRRSALEKVAAEAGPHASIHPADVGDAQAVATAIGEAIERHGRVDALVACAGINIPRRAWSEISIEDYRSVMQANLDGVFHCVHAVLPAMRRQRAGTIVVINSEAGRAATQKAGCAYVASKFGLAGLVQSINAEERVNGIRACSIFPGDVNTPLLDKRSTPPPAEARAVMVQPEDVAECVRLVVQLPSRAIIEEMVIRPA